MVHGKRAKPSKSRAPMIRYRSHKQLPLAEFEWPFQTALDENNRWVRMSGCIPWDELAFPTIYHTLRLYLRDQESNAYRFHMGDLLRGTNGSEYIPHALPYPAKPEQNNC